MADLEKSRTKGSNRSRPNTPSNPDRPQISRVFTGQHLDDHSTYHGRDSRIVNNDDSIGDEESDLSERVSREENEELGEKLPSETVEVRNGVANVRDLEAPLEKKQSSKSAKAKDPNLVSIAKSRI